MTEFSFDLTPSELSAFATHLAGIDQKLTGDQQYFARNMVQQTKARLAGEFNAARWEKEFNAQLVRFFIAGGMTA